MLLRKRPIPYYLKMLVFCTILQSSVALPAESDQANKLPAQTQQQVADQLGWVVVKAKKAADSNACKLCDGYYFEPAELAKIPNPLPMSELQTDITSPGPARFEQNGVSELTEGVVITQPGRRITADTAFIYRDAKLGKVTGIDLVGNVHLQQYNRLVIATFAHLDLTNDTIILKHALYHFGPLSPTTATSVPIPVATPGSMSSAVKYDAWGYAEYAHNPTQMLINFTSSTYSTCTPLNRVWMVSGKNIHLDRDRGIGTVKHMVLRIKKVPVAYFPYFRFPLDNRRLTGFLMPVLNGSTTYGRSIGFPFYWNMAPNYDTTITPYYNEERGFQLQDMFRYLTPGGKGTLDIGFTPNDEDFANYKAQTVAEYQGDSNLQDYVNQLEKDNDDRAYIGFNGLQQWDTDWNSIFDLNYVTDPYYFRDNTIQQPIFWQPNQLLNEATLDYSGLHWTFSSMVQAYQTLQRIDQFANPVYNQYERLPEFDTTGFYPNIWKDLNWGVSAQAVDFQFSSTFPTATNTIPTPVGQRFNVRPTFDYNQMWSAGYIDPQVYVDDTSYITQFQQTSQSGTLPDFNESRVIPITDVDAGLYFDRDFTIGKDSYIQTLEPRLFYLWVPYEDQNAYPNFDTELLPFSFQQLFSVNRFTGLDRIENANQVSLGLTSNIIDSDTNAPKLQADLGIAYYMANPEVELPGTALPAETFSPVAGSLTYYFNQQWSTTTQAAWDVNYGVGINNASSGITYNAGSDRLFNIGYEFVSAAGTNLVGITNDTNNIYAGTSWPFYYHWTGFAYAQYVFNGNYPENYFAGIQYDACCWAIRLIYQRQYVSMSPSSTVGNVINQFNNVYYIQLQLKGLYGVSDNSASELLTSRLPGYTDPFLNENF